MRKLFIILGAFLLITALAGCTTGGDVVVTAPSYVGVQIDEMNPFDGTNFELYSKHKDEPVLVEVVLDNPDNLDIRAVYINQYSYRSNTFLKGVDLLPDDSDDNGIACVANGRETEFSSTKDNLFFCMDAGDTLELTEYTVDRVEYFDGSDTKDLLVSSNNEFHMYVYKSLPSAERENYSLSQDSISVDFDVEDDDNVIIAGTLFAQILLGTDELPALEQPLNVGLNSVVFDTDILSNTNYEIRIVANYDIDDSTGVHETQLFTGNFTTLPTLIPSANIENVLVTSNEVTFDVNYEDIDGVTVPGESRVAVFDGETEVDSVGINGTVTGLSFENLLNSKQYSLRIISNYDLRDGEGTHTEYVLSQEGFETTARTVPVPMINNVIVEENRIIFNILLEDDPIEPIIDISTLYANVYVDDILEDTVLISGSEVELQINDVLSGKDIRVDFLATFDLNDGNGPQPDQVIGVFTRVSLLNSLPEVSVRNVEVTQGYVNIDLSVLDVSNTLLSSVRAVLYRVEEVDDVEVEVYIDTQYLSLESSLATFSHLIESDSNYRVKMIADYNLLDGEGNKIDQVLYTQEITSLQPKAPAAEIHDPIITNDGLEFDVIVMDADGTAVPSSLSIHIYRDGVLLDTLDQLLSVGTNHVSYTGLNSNYTYDFEIEADFDISDGSGLQVDQVLLEQSLTTLAKELPTASIGAIDSTTDSITFDVTVEDFDTVIEPNSIFAVLYYNNTATGLQQPLLVGENLGVSFAGINSNTPYTIEIISNYNLSDGVGIVTEYTMTEMDFYTKAKEVPVAIIDDIEPTTDTITFDVTLSDSDSVLTSQAQAVLYIGDTYTGQSIDLDVGLNTDISFTNVFSDQPYIIYVVADYNLNDNINVETGAQIAFAFTETNPNMMVTGELYDITVAIEFITFSANIIDLDGVVTTELRAYLIEDGIRTGDYIDLNEGPNEGLSFINLQSDSLYQIELSTNYNLGDVTQEQNVILDTFSTATSAYTIPEAYITIVDRTFDEVEFDVTVVDSSTTSTGDYKAVLFYEGLRTPREIIIYEGLNQILTFDGLLSGVPYEIKIEAVYDLVDGAEEITDFISTTEFNTIAKQVPVGVAENIEVTENQLYFEFRYVDEDNTLDSDSFIAWIFDENNQEIDHVSIADSEVFFDLSYMASNQNITIRISADYDLSDGEPVVGGFILNLDLTTYVNEEPTVVISDTQINQEDVTFQLYVSDKDEVLLGDLLVDIFDSLGAPIGTVVVPLSYSEELGYYYDGEVTVPNTTLVQGILHNLQIVADYNLRDTNGDQLNVIVGEKEIMAVNKIIPQAVIYNEVLDSNEMTVDIVIYDHHLAYVGNASVAIFLNGSQIGVSQTLDIHPLTNTITFTGLPLSDADYEIVVTLDYDNADDNGTITDYVVASEIHHSVAKLEPIADVTIVLVDKDSATLDIDIIDDDGVITLGSIEAIIYKDGAPAGLPVVPLLNGFNDDELIELLLSDNGYDVRIFADYDLGDGVTVENDALIGNLEFTTEAKELPTAEITFMDVQKDTISFDLDITDLDTVIDVPGGNIEAVLYKLNGTVHQSAAVSALSSTVSFTDVHSNTEYRLDIVVNYDLSNGLPIYEDRTILSVNPTTIGKVDPTAEIEGIVTDHNSVIFNVIVTDTDDVIDDVTGNLKAVLYLSGVAVPGAEEALIEGANTNIEFTGLLSIRNYDIRIVADLDYKDGYDPLLETELISDSALTTETVVPLVEENQFTNVELTNSTIEFDVNVWDDTETIVGLLRAELFKDGEYDGQTISLNVGDNLDKQFVGLEYGVEYEIRIVGTYNNNYGTPDEPDYLIYYELITTTPLVEIGDVILQTDSVLFDVVVDDEFGIMANQVLRLELFDETGAAIGTQFTVGSSTLQFENYYNEEVYRVDIYANITGEGSPILVSVQELAVPALQVQSIGWSDIVIDIALDTVDVEITINLIDPVVIDETATVNAVLYSIDSLGNVVQEGTVVLLDGSNVIQFTPTDVVAGTTYMIVIEGTVDFNDGVTYPADYAIATRTFVPVQ